MLLRSSPLQSAWKWFRRRKFGVTARSVHATDLNEASHEHDESNTHQQHCPPMSHDPLCYVLVEFGVEDGLL